MPKITSYTPAWLSSPNPGHAIFSPSVKDVSYPSLSSNSSGKKAPKPGPRRTIARRGTEVFVAVGREIRWADLVYLKEAWEDGEERKNDPRNKRREASQYNEERSQGYRTIKTPVADNIRQLIISPNSNYLAVLTTHTIHIAMLPEPSHLTAVDTGPMRLKTYTLGPVTHVTSQSALASVLWHPLGVDGASLVTVTEDAIVRVWELSPSDRWSFDKPTLAIDLKRLADGTYVDEDFGASISATNKTFSPDSFEMEVAAASFAGRGSGGWSPMTLWIAMRGGDVYALCPLLPETWSPPATLIPSLSVSIVSKVAAMEDDNSISPKAKMLAQQQLAWMAEIDKQEPSITNGAIGEPPAEVYSRPNKPGRVPKLQGPFDFDLALEDTDNDLDSLITDIHVIGPKIDGDELMFGEEEDLEVDDVDQEGLSVGVVCLLTSSGRLSINLDLDGVEAQWLPKSNTKTPRFMDGGDPPSLLTFETLETIRASDMWEGSWPVFSHDVKSRYSFYVTNTTRVTYISLDWVFALERELSEGDRGSEFRIDLLAKGQSIRQKVFAQKMHDTSSPLCASTMIEDPDLGYVLLTATPHNPILVTFEPPEVEYVSAYRAHSESFEEKVEQSLVYVEPREVYQPSPAFSQSSRLLDLLDKVKHGKYQRIVKEPIRLSPATLTILTDAHKLLSEETHRLGTAAAELFRKCEELQVEMRSQLRKTSERARAIDEISGHDFDSGDLSNEDRSIVPINVSIERRLSEAVERQKKIMERLERMRKRVTKGTSKELSSAERAWIREMSVLGTKVLGNDEEDEQDSEYLDKDANEPWRRYEEVKRLMADLIEEVKDVAEEEETTKTSSVKVPSEIRKAKLAQITALLDRETALVEGAKSRLERLSLS